MSKHIVHGYIILVVAMITTKVWADDFRAIYAKVQAELSLFKTLEAQVNHLIEVKNHTDDPEKARPIVDQLVSTHKQMVEANEKLQKDLVRLRYQYPDQGEAFVRKYPRVEIQSLEDMEKAQGLRAELDRAKIRTRQVFGTTPPEEPRAPASETAKKVPDDAYIPPALIK